MALMVALLLAALPLPGQARGKELAVAHPTSYRTVQVDGLSIFYPEAVASAPGRPVSESGRLCRGEGNQGRDKRGRLLIGRS